MRQTTKKMCVNCEADVASSATYCPFCGNDLTTTEAPQENLASLYKPPYQARNRRGFGIPNERSDRDYDHVAEPKEDPLFPDYSTAQSPPPAEEKQAVGIWPILLLSLGANLMMLGLLLFFFSDGGTLTLKWNSHAWFIYCLLSLPLLMMGYRVLSPKIDDM